jgi:hypothetical protein
MSRKIKIDRTKEMRTDPQPIVATRPLPIFFPNKALIKKPSKGKSGTSVTNFTMLLPL